VYRSRPKGKLDKDTLNFLSSGRADLRILHYDIIGSEAHCIMLYEVGILALPELKEIIQLLEEVKIKPEILSSYGFEDIHESVEAFVIERAGMSIGGKLQTGRSRNDQVILDIRMKIRDDINHICSEIADLIDVLLTKATENKETIMPMYTHLQHAQIGTFSHYLLSYADALFRDLDRLHMAYGRINRSPLGASAVGGSSININRTRTATLLGFDGIIKNSIDATSSRDCLLEFTGVLTIMIMTLSRMAEDLILWSTNEFGYIDISEEHSSTSSAMPNKRNPDPLELIRSKAGLALGNLVAVATILKALPSGYSRDLQDLKPVLWQVSDTAIEVLTMMNRIMKLLVIHKERMQEVANNSYAISIDIAERLVVKKKMPFRLAHRLVGSLVHTAAFQNNIPLTKLREDEIRSVMEKNEFNLEPQELMQMITEVTPRNALQFRLSAGSPNPKEQQEMISCSKSRLLQYKKETLRLRMWVEEAFDKLGLSLETYLNTCE
jgi:argininosuccinate lyase